MKQERLILYGLFRENLETKLIEGFIESSFSMGWSQDRVRHWDQKEVNYYYLKYITFDKRFCNPTDKGKFRYFIKRLTRKNDSIQVDLSPGKDKFTWRNKIFKIVD